MKIRFFSDLHNEFANARVNTNDYHIKEHPEDKDTVLCLLGDIGTKARAIDYANSFSDRFKAIILIAGNHDYYGTSIQSLQDKWKAEAKINVYPLFSDIVVIDDIVFVGCTMWTNFNNEDSLVMFEAPRIMRPDYKKITYRHSNGKYSLITPEIILKEHTAFVSYLKFILSEFKDKKIVVCTHHSPSYTNESKQFAGNMSSYYYHSNLNDIVCDVDAWLFGHTHYNVHSVVGEKSTVMSSNQRGYFDNYEHGFDEFKYIEV